MAKTPAITLVDDNGLPLKSTPNGDGTAGLSPAATAITFLTYSSTAQAAANVGTSFSTASITSLAVDATVASFAAGTAPSVTFFVDRFAADGVWYRLWTSAAITAAGPVSQSVAPGLSGTGTTSAVLTGTARFGWLFAGAPTSVTFSASVIGR